MNSLCSISGHGFRNVNAVIPLSFATCQGAYGCKLLNSSYMLPRFDASF